MNKYKPYIVTSLFWVSIAGVIILVQFVQKTSYTKGVLDGVKIEKSQVK